MGLNVLFSTIVGDYISVLNEKMFVLLLDPLILLFQHL